jgi:hypothetical protein
MNWVRANKLLAVFLVFAVPGALVLGYLLYNAYGSYAEISKKYAMQIRELDRLQSLRPYPDLDNLNREEKQRDALAARIDELRRGLALIEAPPVPLTPEQFQDELRKTVSELANRAVAQGTWLPEDFYLGFQKYRDTLPNDSAAGPLGRQLEAVKFVVSVLLDNRVGAILHVDRAFLPEEGAEKFVPTTKKKVSTKDREALPLVTRHPIQIEFKGTPRSFRRSWNSIASTQKQFYIVDLVKVTNEKLAGPARRSPPPPSSDESPSGGRIQLVAGDEKVNVRMSIQIVDFLDPGAGSAGEDK